MIKGNITKILLCFFLAHPDYDLCHTFVLDVYLGCKECEHGYGALKIKR